MVYAITVLIGIVLLCVITMCIMVSRAMDYDPPRDEDQDLLRREYDEEE